MKLKKLELHVLNALEMHEETRKDDFKLYAAVLIRLNVSLHNTIGDLLFNGKRIKLPSFESVSRCRRHIQAIRPELKDTKTAIAREEAQDVYRDYNLTDIGE